jgi:hypothetical protein
MRLLATAATGLALFATSAFAQSAEGNDQATVTLNATVGDYLAITDHQNSTIGELDIAEGSGVAANNNSTNSAVNEKATFEVTANVAYNIELDWQTWQEANLAIPDGVSQTYQQANYYNGDVGCSIGGTVSFDPDPDPGAQNDTVPASGGATPLSVPGSFDPGIAVYGVNTEASPNVTNCIGDVAAPGTYSLDVEITLSAS